MDFLDVPNTVYSFRKNDIHPNKARMARTHISRDVTSQNTGPELALSLVLQNTLGNTCLWHNIGVQSHFKFRWYRVQYIVPQFEASESLQNTWNRVYLHACKLSMLGLGHWLIFGVTWYQKHSRASWDKKLLFTNKRYELRPSIFPFDS